MPPDREDPVDLPDIVHLLRTRWRPILLSTLAGCSAALAITLTTPPKYRANTQLFVTTSSAADDLGSQYTGSLFAQVRVKSYAEIVRSPLVTQPVVDRLGLPFSPQVLGTRITATAPLDKVLINVSVTDTDPLRAAQVVNAVAEQFTGVVAELEATSEGAAAPVRLTVTEPAIESALVSPRPLLNLILGLAIGMLAGLALAFGREKFDTRIKGAEGLRELFTLNTLGVVGFDQDTPVRPLITQVTSHAPRAEAYRQIRTNLQFADVDRPPQSIVVTSALPGEGKSTTSCNLAIALAEAGRPVILIEADMRRPKLGQYLGLPEGVGLSDVLAGRVDLHDAIQEWGATARMSVLLSGARPPNPAELLDSRQMVDLVRRLERDFFVVIDAPPLLPVTDAAVLGRCASGVVLVLRAGRTREGEVRQALTNLAAVDARVYGAVLNMAPTNGPDSRRYGYASGYGQDYGPDRPEPEGLKQHA